MKGLFGGIVLIVLVGLAGFLYRNATEHPLQPIVCPLDALVCPDGSIVSRTGSSCTFAECPLPNISIPVGDAKLSFAIPEGFVAITPSDASMIAAYEMSDASSTVVARITIRHYGVEASSTPSAVIQDTAITAAGGPAAVTAYSSIVSSNRRYTVVAIERSANSVSTAYYLVHGTDLLRFDAIDMHVENWNDPNLDKTTLPAHVALKKLLSTLQMI